MAFGERWLTSLWPFVAAQLPAAPARVLELGCGPLGGFVPALLANGYTAIGIDAKAPEGESYRQVAFEDYAAPQAVDAIVASRSLHHVGDVGLVLDHAAEALRPGGVMIVAEWAWEQFDEETAHWCFEHVRDSDGADPGWLLRRRKGWLASGATWDAYFGDWTSGHGLQPSDLVVEELYRRFERVLCVREPYFFADLADIPEADERAAIDAGEIRATGVRYAGVKAS